MKLQNKQQKNMEKKLLPEDEVFCISRSCSFPFASEQSKAFCALFQQWLQNCTSAKAGLLAAVQCFGLKYIAAECKWEVTGPDQASCTTAAQGFWATPGWASPTSDHGCSSLWSRIGNQKHHNSSIKARYYPVSSKSTFRAVAPLCALSPNAVTDLTSNAPRKEMLQRQNIAQQHSAYAVLIRCQL